MLKKLSCIFLTVMLIMVSAMPTYANSPEVIYFSDGSYMVTTITSPEISLFSSTATRTKSSIYYSSSNKKLWSVSVTGTFTYGNGSASCTSSSCSASSYDSNWSVGNKKASKIGNKATASATGVEYINGHQVQSYSKSVTLTCSSTGQFS